MERSFATYSDLVAGLTSFYEQRFPKEPPIPTSSGSRRSGPRPATPPAGLLPASTLSNVGIYGTGQAYEMAADADAGPSPRRGADYGQMMLEELRKVIPSFLTRVDLPDRGVAWSEYLAATRKDLEDLAPPSWEDPQPGERPAG